MDEKRKVFGENLILEEQVALAQLTTAPGWKILVKLMAEACREATEKVIKLDPTTERYPEVLAGLQTTARAMNKFSADVLDSVRVHQRKAVMAVQQQENPQLVPEPPKRFQLPIVKSPTEKVGPQ
jgi:hypothetical protein